MCVYILLHLYVNEKLLLLGSVVNPLNGRHVIMNTERNNQLIERKKSNQWFHILTLPLANQKRDLPVVKTLCVKKMQETKKKTATSGWVCHSCWPPANQNKSSSQRQGV